MSRSVRDAALLAGLVLLSAAFVDVIRGGVAAPPALTSAPAPAPEPVEAPALPEIEPAPLEALTVALRRPLFFQSRRPPAAPTPAPAELAATLAGVLTTDAEKVAIVMPANADRATRLREGDLFRGWRVVSIDEQSVALERDGRTETLSLSFRRPAPPGPEPARGGQPAAGEEE